MDDDGIILSVRCPHCGERELRSDQVWLVFAPGTARSTYRFDCTGCGQGVSHQADPAVVSVLSELVAVGALSVPTEALSSDEEPVLTVDDLIDLMLAPLTDVIALESELPCTQPSVGARA